MGGSAWRLTLRLDYTSRPPLVIYRELHSLTNLEGRSPAPPTISRAVMRTTERQPTSKIRDMSFSWGVLPGLAEVVCKLVQSSAEPHATRQEAEVVSRAELEMLTRFGSRPTKATSREAPYLQGLCEPGSPMHESNTLGYFGKFICLSILPIRTSSI
jgi:hypothetical protein